MPAVFLPVSSYLRHRRLCQEHPHLLVITLGEARLKLADYAPAVSLTERINRACEMLLTLSRPKDFLDRVALTSYNETITLPRRYSACVGIVRNTAPIPIRNGWVEFILDGAGEVASDSMHLSGEVVDLGDGFPSFREPGWINTAGCVLRWKTDAGAGETSPITLLAKGSLAGTTIRTTGATPYYGDKAIMTTGANATSVKTFDKVTQVAKPTTVGLISLYAVNPSDSSENLIATYEPNERAPGYRRYKIPQDPLGADSYVLTALCQRRYVEASDDNDPIPVSNLSALQDAMLSIQYRLANDDDRARTTLSDALAKITGETSKFRPANQYPPMVQFCQGGGAGLFSFR